MFSPVSVCHSVQVATEARTVGKRVVRILLDFSRNTQRWYYCATLNENKFEVVTSGINLHLS